MLPEVESIIQKLDELGYVVEEELATILLLTLKLEKPILLEGPPGVGKTEAAHILSNHLGTNLIRLQCYEGLDVNTSIYEWNYQKQLLSIKINERDQMKSSELEKHIFDEEYLLKRPLLQAISESERPPVLLIDEVDRADEEFEAFLLEILSDFQITIPELGTIKARHRPVVVLTSNRTRELSDALKRRCLYHWVDYPSFEKEKRIVKKHLPNIEESLVDKVVLFVENLRKKKLQKSPGISETIDWATGLLTLGGEFDAETIKKSLGCIIKSEADLQVVKNVGVSELLQETE